MSNSLSVVVRKWYRCVSFSKFWLMHHQWDRSVHSYFREIIIILLFWMLETRSRVNHHIHWIFCFRRCCWLIQPQWSEDSSFPILRVSVIRLDKLPVGINASHWTVHRSNPVFFSMYHTGGETSGRIIDCCLAHLRDNFLLEFVARSIFTCNL